MNCVCEVKGFPLGCLSNGNAFLPSLRLGADAIALTALRS